MSRYDCRRCDWKPEADSPFHPGDQLADHAATARHFLCRCCLQSLGDTQSDWFACESCLTEARSQLSGIMTLWQQLPAHLGHLTGMRYDSDRKGASDGRPLHGGDVLTLLAYGGMGVSESAETHSQKDAPSVAFTLTSWEDDWRRTRGDGAAQVDGSTTRALLAAAAYLDTFCRWAAQHHEAFEEFLSELKTLHARLERATHTHEHVVRSSVECVECGATLVKQDRPRRDCGHRPPMPAEHAECDQGGLRDEWVCPRTSCREVYDATRYALAASGAARERLREHWVTVESAATLLKIPADTIRKWVRRERVRSDRDSEGRVLVWYADVEDRVGMREAG